MHPQAVWQHTRRRRIASVRLAPAWQERGPRQPVQNRTLTGGGVGVPVFAQVRVWDLNQFATYEAAVAGGGIIGTSTIFTYNQRLSSPPATTDTYMTDGSGNPLFQSFSLVPEPSVIGLGIIGVGALFMLRRRK